MTFSNLTQTTQDLLLVEYSFFYKFVVLFGAFIFALFYLFYWKKEKEQPTPFYTVGVIRIILTCVSWVSIVLFPLILLLLSPDYALNTFIDWFVPLYVSFIIVGFVTIVVDSLYYLPTVLLKFGGFDMNDPKVNKVYNKIKKQFKR